MKHVIFAGLVVFAALHIRLASFGLDKFGHVFELFLYVQFFGSLIFCAIRSNFWDVRNLIILFSFQLVLVVAILSVAGSLIYL
jgi:hypothetical protein